MSANDQEYDNQNDDNQNYDDDDDGQDQEQEYDSQEENSQNNGDNDGDDDCGYEEGNDCNDEDDDDDDEDENSDGPKYIRLRGLPWSATHKEILYFLKGINVVDGAEGIYIVTRRSDGVNTGEAYVKLKGPEDAAAALKLDKATMGHRYIEVFRASPKEANYAMRKTSSHGKSYVVKLRGLPYSVTKQQVEEFFDGLDIKPDREGIVFVMDRRGRATGEAFVQFESQEDTEQALGRNRQKIGHRYIEIFRSSLAELKRSTNGGNGRMAPYDLKDRGGNRGDGNGSDYGGNNRWGSFGVGANNTLGFNNLPIFGNNGNFGNNNGNNFGNFGNNGGGGGGGMGNFGNFGSHNNGGGNFGNNSGGGNFGNNSGGSNMGGGGGNFNRFSGNSGNFGNDFEDFGNFGNNRGNNGMSGAGNNMGGGGGGGGFGNNFSNFGNGGGNNMGGSGGGGFGNNISGGPGNGGGNFCPIAGRNEDMYMITMRGLPYTSFENDVYAFFEPLRPFQVRINRQNGRHTGKAEVWFKYYSDAQLAMNHHRKKMGQRYIELFFNGKPKPGKGGGGGGGGVGGGIRRGKMGTVDVANSFSRHF